MTLRPAWERAALEAVGTQNYVGLIPAPANGNFILDLGSTQDVLITGISAKLTSGTATVSCGIGPADGAKVAVTGASVAATAARASAAATGLNYLAAGQALVLTVAAGAAPVDLAFSVTYRQL